MRHRRGGIVVLLAFLVWSEGLAFGVRKDEGPFDALTIPDPSLVTNVDSRALESLPSSHRLRLAWDRFSAQEPRAWRVQIDGRSGAPLLVEGPGIAWPAEDLEASIRAFLRENRDLLLAADAELRLDADATGPLGARTWQVAFEREVNGVEVEGDRYVFTFGYGNLISFGCSRWTTVDVATTPSMPAPLAVETLMAYMRLAGTDAARLLADPVLRLVPDPAESREIGHGYASHLVWRVVLAVDGAPGTWVGLVDAHEGQVRAFFDDDRYAQVKGGVHPVAPDGICPSGCEQPNYPMPFVHVSIDGSPFFPSSAMGLFDCSPGVPAVTQLKSQTIAIADACGAVNETAICDADLDLSVNAGTNCTVPAGHSAGDTKASRSCFWTASRAKEHARAWMPENVWLTATQTQVNANVNNTCNAQWTTQQQLNMFRASTPGPSGCNNTCEVAGVVQHEWGHGMDQNDGGGFDNPSEAYGDVSELLADHTSCIGRGFYMGQTCSGYGDTCLTCTGIREMDWNARALHTPATIAGTLIGGCPGGGGPCGKEVHCEAHLAGEAIYDLAARDLPAAGFDQATSWQIVDRLWYTSRTGSGGNMYTCTAGSGGCAASSLFARLRTADDDDGNLANGTPHAAALFAAFARHGIACGAAGDAGNQSTSFPPVLTSLGLSGNPNPNAAVLTISHVPFAPDAAAVFKILRNDLSCDDAFTLVGTAPGSATTYTDTGLPNGFPVHYRVQGIGANPAHESAVSNCVTVVPQPFAGTVAFDQPVYSCSSTMGITVVDGNIGSSTVQVAIRSTTEGTPEDVTLTQVSPDSATYTGSLTTTAAPPTSNGQLSVGNGDTVTVAYVDADDGSGGSGVLHEATAVADCAPPVITSVQSDSLSGSSARIRWTTNEASDSQVHYGTTPPPGSTSSAPALVTSHILSLTGLADCTDYVYAVASADAEGNGAADSNGGSYYTFRTGRDASPSYPSTGGPIVIPDGNAAGASMVVTVPDDRTVVDVEVTVNVTHPFDSDLVVSLIPPLGSPITLANRRGGAGDNFTNTTFDDEAAIAISSGTAPFSGRFRPDSPLSAADGISSAGTWTLRVVDVLGGFVGTLDGFALTLTFPTQICGTHAKVRGHTTVTDACATGGGGDGYWDAGETVQFSVTVENDGTEPLTGVSAALTSPTPGVVILDGAASYPDLAGGASATSLAPHYTVKVPSAGACGASLQLDLQITSDQGSWAGSFTHQTGHFLPPPTATVLNVNFSGGIPGTWTVVDGGSGGGAAGTWTTANPGSRLFPLPLAAPVAAVDSNSAGAGAIQNEELITPVLDLGTAIGVTLQLDHSFRWFSGGQNEKGDVDVRSSLTGGAWVHVFRNQDGSSPNPEHKTLDLTAQAAGASNVQIRFHYYDAQFEWWWQVDNVRVDITQAPACVTTPCATPPTAKPVASMTVFRVNATTLDVHWDVATCASTDHEILYGTLATLPGYALSGSVCGIGTSGATTWSGVPAGNLWFLVTGVDGAGTEATWGLATAGHRNGGTPSGQCGNTTRNNAATCP